MKQILRDWIANDMTERANGEISATTAAFYFAGWLSRSNIEAPGWDGIDLLDALRQLGYKIYTAKNGVVMIKGLRPLGC